MGPWVGLLGTWYSSRDKIASPHDLSKIAQQKCLGKTRYCVAHKIMRPDVRELAARIEPDCSAKRPPTAAECVVLAEIVSSFSVDQTVEKGEEIGTRVGLGGVVSRRVVRFGIFYRHQLKNMPLDQQEARAGVNTRDKSVRGLALFAFARQSYVAKLSGL